MAILEMRVAIDEADYSYLRVKISKMMKAINMMTKPPMIKAARIFDS